MKPFVLVSSFLLMSAAAWAIAPGTFVRGPKNLMSPTYHPVATAPAPHELTAKEATKLAATAEKASDHRTLASFYQAEADKHEAKATAYEKAAADLRAKPAPKSVAAPGTAARWEFAAKACRKEVARNHSAAVAHENMAVAAGL